jgi:hypothetical protein
MALTSLSPASGTCWTMRTLITAALVLVLTACTTTQSFEAYLDPSELLPDGDPR